MLNRTTSYPFQSYGDVLYAMPPVTKPERETVHTLSSKTANQSYISTAPVLLECPEGIALLAVSVDGLRFEEFVMHRTVKLKPGVHFALISISSRSKIKVRCIPESVAIHPMDLELTYDPVISRLQVKEVLTSYYQVRKGAYQSGKEKNNFYELVFLDGGQMDVLVDGQPWHLEKYDLMVYHPGQRHSFETPENGSASFMSITFTMDSQLEGSLKDRIFHADKELGSLLHKFMQAMQEDDLLSRELAMLHLKEALVLLYQSGTAAPEKNPGPVKYEDTLLNEVILFIKNNIYTAYTVEDLCLKFSISRSSLQALFRANLGMSPKQYISELKLNEAKKLISEKEYSISQISDMLGFTSIHYFSRRFKNYFGVAPSEYGKGNKAE